MSLVGKAMQRVGLPGFIKPIEFEDAVSGHHICVSTSEFYTILSIGCRDFDGTGGSADCDTNGTPHDLQQIAVGEKAFRFRTGPAVCTKPDYSE